MRNACGAGGEEGGTKKCCTGPNKLQGGARVAAAFKGAVWKRRGGRNAPDWLWSIHPAGTISFAPLGYVMVTAACCPRMSRAAFTRRDFSALLAAIGGKGQGGRAA